MANGPAPGSRATGTWTRRIPTRETSTCSGRDRCSNSCPPRAPTLARIRWRAGCWRPADPATARARQEAVDELRPRVDLREDLAVVAEESRTARGPGVAGGLGRGAGVARARRGCTPPRGRSLRWAWLGASALAVYVLSLMGAFRISVAASILLRDVFLAALAVNATFLYRVHKRIEAVVTAAEEAAHELKLLSEVLLRLERESFQSPLLAALRASLDTEGAPPSRRIGRLNRLMELLDSRDHVLLRRGGTVCAVDHAPGLRRGGVAAALRPGGPPMAHGHR